MATPSAPLKVLIAHTDAQFREDVRQALAVEGYAVLEAAEGEQGLELAAAEQPRIIVIDLVLPRLAGAKMLQELYRRAPEQRQTPVLAVIDGRTREDDIDSVVAVCPEVEFVKVDWVLGHIVAKVQELVQRATDAPQPAR